MQPSQSHAPHDQSLHAIGCERYFPIDITSYDGDLPSGEPNDWFVQSDELDNTPARSERRVNS